MSVKEVVIRVLLSLFFVAYFTFLAFCWWQGGGGRLMQLYGAAGLGFMGAYMVWAILIARV